MAQTGLQIEAGQDYIQVKVEGIPLGRYAPQIFQLLSQHKLDQVRRVLAQPVFSERDIALQWFPPPLVQHIKPWAEITLTEKIRCLTQLIEIKNSIDTFRQQLSCDDESTSRIIDPILQNLTVIPSTESIFFADEHPLIVHWGYYPQNRVALNLHSLHQDLAQQVAAQYPPAEPPFIETLSPPAPTRTRVYLLSTGLVAVLVSTLVIVNVLQPAIKPPRTVSPPVVASIDEVKQTLDDVMAASRALPLSPAEFIAPPPELTSAPEKISRVPLMIPARSRYQGSIDFLASRWTTHLEFSDRRITMTYDFNNDQASTLLSSGSQQCSATSRAAFTAKGKLLINTAKARCSDGKNLPAITVICEKSAPHTQCFWQQRSKTLMPIDLFSEKKS